MLLRDKTEATNWACDEFHTISFSDERLNQRLIKMTNQFSAQPMAPINQACDDWADTKAAYRFFDNPKVTASQILSPHLKRTVQRMQSQTLVLAVQDTTFLDYTHHPKTEGLGPIGTKKQQLRGLVNHTTLAVTPSGLPLGILTEEIWARDDDKQGESENRKSRAIETKESYKWISALRETKKLCPDDVRLVTVCDREADVYEFMVESIAQQTEFLIRATQNRCVTDSVGKLRAKVESQPIAGKLIVQVPEKNNEPARTAIVNVHFASAILRPPHRSKAIQPQPLPPVDVSAIWVREFNPPSGVTPLDWLLLTNVLATNIDQAVQCVRWYRCRWQIEVYFKVLKSGCRVEDCRLETAQRLVRYLTLFSIIAWRIYWLGTINRHYPEAPCTMVLAEHEWKALYTITHQTANLPAVKPTVNQVVRWIAKLGGFLDRKADGQPGVTVIWRGWQRLTDIAKTWALLNPPGLMGNS